MSALAAAAAHARLADLAAAVSPLEAADRATVARDRFRAAPTRLALPVQENGLVRGVVLREAVIRLADEDARPCRAFIDTSALHLDASMPCQDAAALLAQVAGPIFLLPIVVTEGDTYRGLCTAQDVLGALGHQLVESQRQPHRLTGLSGVTLLEMQIARLLGEGRPFTAALIDIRGMSVYNRVFGYGRGDNLIRYVSILLAACADARQEMVADPGGARFMLTLFGDDWRARLEQMLTQFSEGLGAFVSAEDHARHGYSSVGRDRREYFHALPALAVGVVHVASHPYSSPAQLLEAMVAATREAKKIPGNMIFVERRAPVPPMRASLGEVPRHVLDSSRPGADLESHPSFLPPEKPTE